MALSKPKGSWTYEDLLTLPEDGRRYEIIAGELYEVPSPSWDHAVILMNLTLLLGPVIRLLGGQLVAAPLDVFFRGADPVQPDLLALLPDSRAGHNPRGVVGPPDLVVEILSPSSRGHDLVTKRALYGQAGVREYWIVDPELKTVEVLTQDQESLRRADLASHTGSISSPLLGMVFPLPAIFANLDEHQS